MRKDPLVRRVLLVGFMGSGKTQVGLALAERLGWGFHDFDQEVKIRSGLSIPEIFHQHGEGVFRQLEAGLARELLEKQSVVLASGGGWPAALGRMENLPEGTYSVWLRVTPEEAIRRVAEEGPTRPLLAVEDPLGRARKLMAEREHYYSMSDVSVDSLKGTPEAMALQIERMMAESGRERLPSTST